MKKLLLAFVAVMSLTALTAQSKVAHVNSQKLLDTLPSRKVAMQELRDFESAGIKELQEMEDDLKKSYEKYMADQANLSPVIRQFEEEKLQKKQMAMQQREQELQQQMSTLSNNLNAPILKRVEKAVELVSDRKKLNYVFDISVALYSKGGVDITNEVLVELLRLDAEESKIK